MAKMSTPLRDLLIVAVVAAGVLPMDGLVLNNCDLSLAGTESGDVTLRSFSALHGGIGPDCRLTIQNPDYNLPWSGDDDIAGQLIVYGGVQWDAARTNLGVIDVQDGFVIGPIFNRGLVRLRANTIFGAPGGHLDLGGVVDVDADARARIDAQSATVSGVIRLRPTNVTFNPIGQYQLSLLSGDCTIDGATLELEPGPGFAPAWGRVYNLIGASVVHGSFAEVIATTPLPNPRWRWELRRHNNTHFRGHIVHVADVNRDLFVDELDVSAILAAWHTSTSGPEDVNGDGFVDFADLAIVVAHFGQSAFG